MRHSLLLKKSSLLLAVIATFAVTGCTSRGGLISPGYAGSAGATSEQAAIGNTGASGDSLFRNNGRVVLVSN